MDQRQRSAIIGFASSIKELKEAGVIRSHRYLGDLAEFLCADAFHIDLAKNLRQAGHDGMRKQLRAQVKYGGGTKKNIDLGDPRTYDEVYVVLGKESVIRSYSHAAEFLVYKLTAKQVVAMGTTKKGKYSCGAKPFRRPPDHTISLDYPVTSNPPPEEENVQESSSTIERALPKEKPSGPRRK